LKQDINPNIFIHARCLTFIFCIHARCLAFVFCLNFGNPL